MKKITKKLLSLLLAAVFCLPLTAAAAGREEIDAHPVIRVGLFYGSDTLSTATLENSVGQGFAFGTTDALGVFTQLAATQEGKITVQADSSGPCAIAVLSAETGAVLYQFQGAEGQMLTLHPLAGEGQKAVTLCGAGQGKNYRYFGDFRYERMGGGNLTVVNLVPLEDYIKGIVPYEMSSSWPVEALKAQAVCARTYTICGLEKHKKYHFDLCATNDCQVYYGVGSATEKTDKAVDDTAGKYVFYGDKLASTYYFSCDGGATEDAKNVWVSDLPYLKGKVDPYEPTVMQGSPHYGWTVTVTKEELRQRLIRRGHTNCGEITKFYVSKTTDLGHVYSITFEDSGGTSYSYFKDDARVLLGLKSLDYEISGGDIAQMGYSINGTGSLSTIQGAFALDGTGAVTSLTEEAFAITKDGVAPLVPMEQTAAGTYTITGDGWGHHVGMSQWGAYAMAQQGLNYLDILNFYFTGIEIK